MDGNKIDRRAVVAAFILFAILFLRLAVMPLRQEADLLRERTAGMNEEIARKTKHLVELEEKSALLGVARDGRPVSAHLAVIEEEIEKIGLSTRLRSVSPVSREIAPGVRGEGFEVRMENLSVFEAVEILSSFQGMEAIYLERFILDRDREGRTLNARVRMITPRVD